jgi:hypothetical protein
MESSTTSDTQFNKSGHPLKSGSSLLTRMMTMSESESFDDEDYVFSEANRTQSSASTYSRGSVTSGCEMMSDGHVSPYHSPPSQPMAAKSLAFPSKATIDPSVEKHDFICDAPASAAVKQPAPSKRCISFACGAEDVPHAREGAQAPRSEKNQEPAKRACALKFLCPTRPSRDINAPKQRTRLASPPPPAKSEAAPPAKPKAHRGSDATVQNGSPATVRKVPVSLRKHRDSASSDISRTEATRFHEFASSDEQKDDWTQESSCFQRRLTIDDTLAIENDLRKLAREVEDEDEDDEEDEEEEEEVDEEEDEEEDDKVSVGSSGYESDTGFHSDDEQASDNENGESDDEWWAPGRSAAGEHAEHIRPSMQRRDSVSTTASDAPFPGINAKGKRRTRPVDVQRPPELPDSTDFVCGTLDEDKPLEQAYLNHLVQRRAAKHRVVPQDIDPTFPTSDPEMSDENEDDDEGDHQLFLHGQMDLNEEEAHEPPSLVPRKRSPTGSPKRLRSPPPAKRVSIHRSPPPPTNRRARSPAPAMFERLRISSSVPRDHHLKSQGPRDIAKPPLLEMDEEEDNENTPRVNRGAIAIVMGLERRRDRRRERLYDRHCRAKAKGGRDKPVAKGRGAERMRDLGVGLNAYRGRKAVVPETAEGDKQILSY